MVIDGKAVRLVLQGDRAEAAKWIPYFAGLCRNMAHAHEKQTATREGMRGWAKNLGGQAFEIYVKVEGGLRYYDLAGDWIEGTNPAQHRVEFFAWALPDAKLDMTGITTDANGVRHMGSSFYFSSPKIITGGYTQFHNRTTAIKGQLYTVYADSVGDDFGTLAFRSKDKRKDQLHEEQLFYDPTLQARYTTVAWDDAIGVTFRVLGSDGWWDDGSINITRIDYTGQVLTSHIVSMIDEAVVRANGGTVSAAMMTRGKSVKVGDEKLRPVYLLFTESYRTPDIYYQWLIRVDAMTGAVLASSRTPLPYPHIPFGRTLGLVSWYVPSIVEWGDYFYVVFGSLIMVGLDARVHQYDLWVFDKETLGLAAVCENLGIAQLGLYKDGNWAMTFPTADFERIYDENDKLVVRMTHGRGAMHQLAIDQSGGVPSFTLGKNLAAFDYHILSDAGTGIEKNTLHENNCGFIERYDD